MTESRATADAIGYDEASLEETLEAAHEPVDIDAGVTRATPPSAAGLALAGAIALLTVLAVIAVAALYATRGA